MSQHRKHLAAESACDDVGSKSVNSMAKEMGAHDVAGIKILFKMWK